MFKRCTFMKYSLIKCSLHKMLAFEMCTCKMQPGLFFKQAAGGASFIMDGRLSIKDDSWETLSPLKLCLKFRGGPRKLWREKPLKPLTGYPYPVQNSVSSPITHHCHQQNSFFFFGRFLPCLVCNMLYISSREPCRLDRKEGKAER